VRDFNVKKAIAVEKNPELAAELKIKSLARLEVMTGDATQISLADNSISRVVTDPPWGKFEQLSEKELSDLYEKSLAEMVRVVKPNGVITILSAVQLQSYTHTLPLELVKEYNILVSGQKATIYKFRVNK
jgi:tRNA G10  N-methylase Trm11